MATASALGEAERGQRGFALDKLRAAPRSPADRDELVAAHTLLSELMRPVIDPTTVTTTILSWTTLQGELGRVRQLPRELRPLHQGPLPAGDGPQLLRALPLRHVQR